MINASCQFCFWDLRILLTNLHPSSVWATLMDFPCEYLLIILRHCQTPHFCILGARGRVAHRLYACLHGGSFLCHKFLTTKLQLPTDRIKCVYLCVFVSSVFCFCSSLRRVSCLCDEINCYLTMVIWFNLMTKHNPSSLSGHFPHRAMCFSLV